MTVLDIDPGLEAELKIILESKKYSGDWNKLIPLVKSRIRQIVDVFYEDYSEYTSCEHIVNINTNSKESRPEEKDLNGLMEGIELLIEQRFNESPPFTLVRISELLLFDTLPNYQIPPRIVYENNPIKYLRLLLLSFNVVTTIKDFDARYQSRPITERGVPIKSEEETKGIIMTPIPWINEVAADDDDDEDEEDEDYIAEDDESGSDLTDNDDIGSQDSVPEEKTTPEKAVNPRLEKLADSGLDSPKIKKDQLDSPHIKRRKSEINIKEDDSDDSMGSISKDEALEAEEGALETQKEILVTAEEVSQTQEEVLVTEEKIEKIEKPDKDIKMNDVKDV